MSKQMVLNLYKGSHGGRRPGSGRKRIHSKGVAHRTRERVNLKIPLHINFKVKASIRNKLCLKILKRAILNGREKGLIISHFSLQSNHVHLIIEARDNKTLTKGMRSLTITFAKNINKGSIQIERYHLHVLKSLNEVKNAVHYVLFNEQKHRNLKRAYVDHFSSLQFHPNLKQLAKEARIAIVMNRGLTEHSFLNGPYSWMLKQVV